MMKNVFKLTLGLCLVGMSFFSVSADTEALSTQATIISTEELVPEIKIPRKFVPVGEVFEIDGGQSLTLSNEVGIPRYSWTFGDGVGAKWGPKVGYLYEKPGVYEVELRLKQGSLMKTTEIQLIAYTRKAILVAERDFETASLVEQAGKNGIWLEVIRFEKNETGLAGEAEFSRKLSEKIEFLRDSEFVVFQPKLGAGLQGFSQWWQKISAEDRFELKSKLWIQTSEDSLSQVRKLVEPTFDVLNPTFLLLTRPAAINVVFENKDTIADKLTNRGIEFQVIDGRSNTSPFLFLSKLTSYFVSHGISQSLIYLILAVPLIVFVIAFARQFVGISTFGVFAPLMLTLSFMLLGLQFGFLVFAVVMIVSYLTRLVFDKVELLYIPRVALLHSTLAISFFVVLGLAVYFQTAIDLTLAIFPMMVISTVSEKFVSAQSEGGIKSALISAGETVLVSFIAYGLTKWSFLESSILTFPELILLPILGNIWLGRFTGLRLSEYFKFRAILRGNEEQE